VTDRLTFYCAACKAKTKWREDDEHSRTFGIRWIYRCVACGRKFITRNRRRFKVDSY